MSDAAVIDLDAAMSLGNNLALVRQIAGSLACRVGGGIRTVDRAHDVLGAGARQIIAGSALFAGGAPDLVFARTLAEAVGRERVIAAVDSRGGHVVIHGWKTALPLSAVESVPVVAATEAPKANAISFSRLTGIPINSAASGSSRRERHARPVRESLSRWRRT